MSFPRYPEYKDSGVEWLGQIPCDWDVTRVKAASHVIPSNVDKHSKADEEPVQLCNYTDVYYHDLVTPHMKFMSATASPAEVAKFALAPGDVVITKDSETADDIAVPAFVAESLPGVICGYHLAIIRPRQDTYGRYLHYLFHARYLRSYFEVQARGLTRVGISQSALGNAPIPQPQFEEQKTIADFLDNETTKIDALIEEQQRLIELLKEKRQAVISHAVTKGLDPDAPMKDSGVEWLGAIPDHWSAVRLKHILAAEGGTMRPGPFGNQLKGDNFVEWSNYPVYNQATVISGDFERCAYTTSQKFDELSGFHTRPRDLLVTSRGTIGRAAIVPDIARTGVVHPCLVRVRLDEGRVLSQFIKRIFQDTDLAQKQLRINSNSTTIEVVYAGTLSEVWVPLPRLKEQNAILRAIKSRSEDLDEAIDEAQSLIGLLTERRSALISASVTGKIDVRNWQSQSDTTDQLPMAAEAPATYEAREP
ncbi:MULTISPECIES: restriction endonuclease subunit S [unclassified Wenzhouxiangella]|uniref:restriction endonuclease subunit S n=1 Tax=unclassified Wenzhouxiangella TaxID=2613841 RepID=UPI000E329E2F|nr:MULTISPECIES: restriction endonuclease subunit S [unclassified Wenzhouxiangella]RFF28890.1 restriction endonuclease subunit S [Wenzhouxiangella sp. 15181]RFP67157.1 restriction endonuclease subunit S [Wenzhouxiangella sp. 15190]